MTARTRLVADAIRDHYAPKGPADAVPTAAVSIAVALADKLDLLVGLLRHRREADRRGRSLRAAPRGARHHPHHPRERPAAEPAAADRRWPAQALASPRRASGAAAGDPGLPRRTPARAVARRGRPPRRPGRRVRRQGAGRRHRPACWPAPTRSPALLRLGRRRQPADRLPPRRQHPAHRGAQGRPARRRRPMPHCCASRPRIDLDHALHADADAVSASARTGGFRGGAWPRWRGCAPRWTRSSIRSP